MARVLSGVRPTGDMHLGNYLGAFRSWVADQHTHDAFYCVVDLHALAEEMEPEVLRARTLATATTLLAVGLDPGACTLFVQSHVRAHAELAWLIGCVATFGELSRMTQFKEKSGGRDTVRAGLFTYPVLMAADILLYQADRVPVGDDQRQHLELTRDVAMRFNNRYGETFTVPEAAVPPVGARVMDLQDPTAKMSKSSESDAGIVYVNDPPDVIAKKIRRAVTDSGAEVRYDPAGKPGVANLLQMLGAATGRSPEAAAEGLHSYGELKEACAEAVTGMLAPVRSRHAELAADPAAVLDVLAQGAGRAAKVADSTLAAAREAMGLIAPPA